MNSIVETQNTDRQLQRLAAQRQLYSKAKTVLAVQVTLAGPVALVTAIIGVAFIEATVVVAAWGALAALADFLLLTPQQRRLRESAAKIQEAFDCEVLDLQWNAFKAGNRPDPELIKEQADRYVKAGHEVGALRNWYPIEIDKLPRHVARTICQRGNCWWSSKQKEAYANLALIVTAALFVAILLVGTIFEARVGDVLIGGVVPLLPTLVLGIRMYNDHLESAERLTRLKEHADALWQQTLDGLGVQKLGVAARQLQDEIYDDRRQGPLVFDVVYRRLRPANERNFIYSATEMVQEATIKLNLVDQKSV